MFLNLNVEKTQLANIAYRRIQNLIKTFSYVENVLRVLISKKDTKFRWINIGDLQVHKPH
jgi:hypothetical protein